MELILSSELTAPPIPSSTNLSCVCDNSPEWMVDFYLIGAYCTSDDIQAAEALVVALCDRCTPRLSLVEFNVLTVLLSASSSPPPVSMATATFPMSSRLSAASSSSSTITGSSGRGGAAGLSATLATGGAVLLGVVGGGLLVF